MKMDSKKVLLDEVCGTQAEDYTSKRAFQNHHWTHAEKDCACDQCTVGSQAYIQLFWVNFEISAGLLELVPALLPEFKTVFRLHFKQVKREK